MHIDGRYAIDGCRFSPKDKRLSSYEIVEVGEIAKEIIDVGRGGLSKRSLNKLKVRIDEKRYPSFSIALLHMWQLPCCLILLRLVPPPFFLFAAIFSLVIVVAYVLIEKPHRYGCIIDFLIGLIRRWSISLLAAVDLKGGNRSRLHPICCLNDNVESKSRKRTSCSELFFIIKSIIPPAL